MLKSNDTCTKGVPPLEEVVPNFEYKKNKFECWVIFLHSHHIFECMLGLDSIGVCKNAFRGEGSAAAY